MVKLGLKIDVQEGSLRLDHGPLIATYLGDNPQDMLAINQMSLMEAGAFIDSQIKPKAIAAGKNGTSPPDPANILNGAGALKSERGPEGVHYE